MTKLVNRNLSPNGVYRSGNVESMNAAEQISEKNISIVAVIAIAAVLLFVVLFVTAWIIRKKKGVSIVFTDRIYMQIGAAMLVLFLLTGYVVGNAVTSSAFHSYLFAVADDTSWGLVNLEGNLTEYQSHPWLLNYWLEHAEEVREVIGDSPLYDNPYVEEEKPVYAGFTEKTGTPEDDLKDIGVSEAEAMPEEEKLLFAAQCYREVGSGYEENIIYHLSDVYLIMADEAGEIRLVFSDDRDGEGWVRLGEKADFRESEKLWNNLYALSDRTFFGWVWKKHDASEGYGLSLHYLDPEQDLELWVCGRISARELQSTLDYTETYRADIIMLLGLIGILIELALYFVVIRPIGRLRKTIVSFRKERDSEKLAKSLDAIRDSTRNEIGLFSGEFSSLTREARQYSEEVTRLAADQERVKTELDMAKNIQSSVLPGVFPPFPERKEFEIYASMKAAREVGGDFYNFFLIDDDHLCLTIADVSGKGVPAALFMMSSKIILENQAEAGLSAAEIMKRANDAICAHNPEDMFVTVWLGILEISSGRLSAVNAGHEYPIVRNAGGAFEVFKDPHGFVAGGFAGMAYKEYTLELTPGAEVFVYTDGLAEASNAENEQFGLQRILQVLNADTEASPEERLKAMSQAAEGFAGDAEQFDDLTMLCLKYNGN